MPLAYRRLLRNGPLVRLLAGEFVSSIGDWLYLVALLVVVYERSSSAALLGLVGAARVAPYVVLSVPAGIVADRVERRLVLLISDLARGILMVLLAWVVAVDGPLAAIVALALLAACFSTFFGPALGSYLPELVADESELAPTNSAWASLENLAFVIGPAIGGLLIAASGLALAFALNAVSFAVIAAILWGLPRAPGRAAVAAADGTRAARERPALSRAAGPLAGLAAIGAAGQFVTGGVGILTVVLATGTLRAGEQGTGYLNAGIGVGGLAGAIVSGALVLRGSLAAPLVGGIVLFAAGVLALGAAPGIVAATIAIAIAAAGALLVEVTDTTLLQRVVPDEVRGRALGVIATVTVLAYALGSLALPAMADRAGPGPTLGVAAGVLIVALIAGVVLLGPAVREGPGSLAPTLARLTVLPAFAGIPPDRMERALRRFTAERVTADQVVIRQGDPADRFYVVVEGRFDVTQLDPGGGPERFLRTMGPDEVFGEIGLLRRSPRTATVTARTDGLLLVLDGTAFLELVGALADVSARLLEPYGPATVPLAR